MGSGTKVPRFESLCGGYRVSQSRQNRNHIEQSVGGQKRVVQMEKREF